MNIKLHPVVAYMIDHGALDTRRMAQLQRAEHLVSGDWVGQIVAHLWSLAERDQWANEEGGWG